MLRALAVPLLLVAALAGCLGNEEPVAQGAATNLSANGTANLTKTLPPAVSLKVSTSGVYPINPGFEQKTLEATEGANVTVDFTNADPNPVTMHDWVVEGVTGAATEQVGSGESSTVSFLAPKAGEYKYYCSVGDHRARGMEGTLTVA